MVQRQCNLGNKREDEEEGFYWLMRLRLTQQINLLELGRFRRKKAERWLKGSFSVVPHWTGRNRK